jgi:capsular exopolysaccharide synthesis family protein
MSDDRFQLEKASAPGHERLVRPENPFHAGATNYAAAYSDDYSLGEGGNIQPQLQEMWRRIRKHKWLIFFLSLVVTTVVTIEVFRTKSVYRATATLEIEKENRTLFRSGDVVIESEESDYGFYVATAMKTKIRLLQSRPLLEDVVIALKLDQNPRFMDVTERKSIWEAIKTISSRIGQSKSSIGPVPVAETPALQPDNRIARSPVEKTRLAPYVDVLASNLSAAAVEDTRMLAISMEHTDAALAATIANTVAEVFIEYSFRNKTKKFNDTSGWLNARTRELQAKVQQAESELASYTGANNIFSTDGKENLTIEKLSGLHAQYMKAQTDRILKQSLYEEVRQGRVAQLPEAFADPKTASLQTKLGEFQTQAAQYVGRFGPDNPRVVDLKKQIAAIEKQMNESRSTLEEKLKADYERAARDEQALNQALETAKNEAVHQNQAAIRFGILKQEVETAKSLYTDFLNKTNQASLQVVDQARNMNVADPAVTPRIPVGPNRFRVILIGLLLSLALGVVLALVIEFLDNTVKTTDDVERLLNLPTLAVIPSVGSRKSRLLLVSKKGDELALTVKGAFKKDGLAKPAPQTEINEMLAGKSQSVLAEAYRGLRTSVLLSAAGSPPKTILFTSSQPGEGKSTTTVNTGVSLAMLGAKVLIIDADLRRPTIHKALNMDSSPGLSTFLSQKDADLGGLIQVTETPNLSALVCGPLPPNPAELISSERMKDLLRLASEDFDHILIDSPPLISVTDPVILATLTQGVVLVVHGGRSKRAIVKRARQELAHVGAKIFGVVLNNVDLEKEGYDDYYYSRYNSYYTNEKKAGASGA